MKGDEESAEGNPGGVKNGLAVPLQESFLRVLALWGVGAHKGGELLPRDGFHGKLMFENSPVYNALFFAHYVNNISCIINERHIDL